VEKLATDHSPPIIDRRFSYQVDKLTAAVAHIMPGQQLRKGISPRDHPMARAASFRVLSRQFH
jgi:hypothetical protein